ncbi:MAG: hypothetical protein O2779_03505 [Nanoarchaeota archaeon]|nr:hypothetical protein [Nanoarchaeota archaeon]
MAQSILFLCGHNAGRSQMAQAFFNHLYTGERYVGESAGTNIASELNAGCVVAMKEIGIDMSKSYPQVFDRSKAYAKVFGMGCGVECDLKIDEDLGIDDPHGKEIDEVRRIRDDVKTAVERIIGDLDG